MSRCRQRRPRQEIVGCGKPWPVSRGQQGGSSGAGLTFFRLTLW